MRISRLILFLKRLMIAALLLFALLGCSQQTAFSNTSDGLEGAKLPVFILGEWLSIEVKSGESEIINIQYKIVFETESTVKFVVIYPDASSEGYTYSYEFADQDSIFVENKRIIGGETWDLEKHEDKLMIIRNFDNKSTTILLERLR